ncbi:putative phosphoribosylaminoimidazole-succinocarboxamide synthase protein [Neofusicoccum parvum]|uniref:Phosphoribosylaminoimidazole-succinocarboxamide synthase protein n=1 Tax=Neofusicoccum parvum TaxID=310453 RepID=A0ACB5S553_9PEZI|nr:putative phosphoribosylaminoimidazole-succinocarboxamide synthase protein [Neofusicoccum parvum]
MLRTIHGFAPLRGPIMKLDAAVAQAIGVDPSAASVSSAGGGGMSSASTSKITAKMPDGSEKQFFMKTGKGDEAAIMFEGEHASLNALHDAVDSLCPKSFGWGQFSSSPSTSFLVTDYLHLTSRLSRTSSTAPSLAAKLAALHTTPAPTPPGYDKPQFGFPATTCCGDTPQDNAYKPSWADFYAENRLRFILRRSERSNGADAELRDLVTRTADEVVPRLLGDAHLGGGAGVTPVVVHGDLWSGNASSGRIGSPDAEVQEVVYDPSACYAHSEYELGIMKMFGGFGGPFLKEYHRLCPKTEPVEEYEDRVALYELYHHLNHHALFGGGYKSGAVSIMRSLLRKYGGSKA